MESNNPQKLVPLTILDLGTSPNKTEIPIKVLISDDDPPTLMLLRASLTQWGYEVIEASDGEEAWEILQQPDPPKLLILDWLMPKLDGINLCTRIRKELSDQSFYIILLSQISGGANIKIAIDGGANEFLSKPFDYQELRSRLFSASKIIKYEIALLEQNNRLKKESSQLQKLSILILAMTKEMDEIIKSSTQFDAAQLQNIHSLQYNLKQASTLIKNLEQNK